MSNHFTYGCPGDTVRDKLNLTVTLLESMDLTLEEVQVAGHRGGLCGALKNKEDDWIMSLGTFDYPGTKLREKLDQDIEL